MKTIFSTALICLLLFVVCCVQAQAQTSISNGEAASVDTAITLDMIVVPNSPGFTLLGISPDDVDRPETPADFAVSVANSANNFSTLPRNYAIEFLPVSLLTNCAKSHKAFTGNNTLSTMLQTFTISSAFATNDDVDTTMPGFIKTRSGIGIRVSILNGKIDKQSEGYDNALQEIRDALINLHNENTAMMDKFRNTDVGYNSLVKERDRLKEVIKKPASEHAALRDQVKLLELTRTDSNSVISILIKNRQMDSLKVVMEEMGKEIREAGPELEKYIEEYKINALKQKTDAAIQLKKKIQDSKFKRTGWILDFAAGMVLGFRNDDFQNSIVQKAGAWLNGGYEDKAFNMLAVARYITTFNSVTDENGNMKNESNFDGGLKLELEALDKKFTLSLEGIARFYIDTIVYRYTVNASYQVGANQALTFALGRDFAGIKQYGGNLIVALNYVKAFGTKRTLAGSK